MKKILFPFIFVFFTTFCFAQTATAGLYNGGGIRSAEEGFAAEEWNRFLDNELSDYTEPVPGAKQRVKKVLWIMLTAWSASKLQKQAETMLSELDA